MSDKYNKGLQSGMRHMLPKLTALTTERDTLREKNALLRRVITNIIESMTDKRFCYIDRCYSAVTICGSDECIDQFMEEPTEEQE